MALKEGDLVITLKKVENIKAIMGKIKEGEIGVITETNANFDKLNVYGVAIRDRIYYLFEDEIEKLEEKC